MEVYDVVLSDGKLTFVLLMGSRMMYIPKEKKGTTDNRVGIGKNRNTTTTMRVCTFATVKRKAV